MQPNYYFHPVLLRNPPYLYILHDEELQMLSFIKAVKINVHNFHLQLTRAETNKTTHKQPNTMAHANPCRHMVLFIHLVIKLFLISIQGSPFTDRWSSMGPSLKTIV